LAKKSKQLAAASPGHRDFPALALSMVLCASRIHFGAAWHLRFGELKRLGARALLALSSGDANGVFYLKHLTRMVPGATDAALSPDESLYKSTICRNSLQTVGNFTLMLISATVIQSIRTIPNRCLRCI
jgi:hypothetical protein